jgi:cytochrome P450
MAPTAYPPGPRSRFPGAHLLAFRRQALEFLCHVSHTYGDVASFRLGPERVVLVTHPEIMHDVLVTQHRAFIKARRGDVSKQFLGEGLLNSEGEFHQRQRRLMQPAFSRQRVTQYATVMTACSTRLRQQWQAGETLDIAQAMARLTLAIAGKTLFNVDLEDEARDLGAAITTLLQVSPRLNLPFAELFMQLPLPSHRRMRRAVQYLDTTIYRLIQTRRAHGSDAGDVLSILLNAQEEQSATTGMTDKQVHDEALTLLLAGHETTAVALTWTWYLLSQHPEVEARLHTELATVLNGRVPTDADLPRLPYTRMVFTEAMRLYPPAWMMTRRTLGEYTLGGYTVPAGTFLLLSPYVTHHDARFFPAPEVFDPERWAMPVNQTKWAYLPFGGGPRQCIGEGFAWMEGLLVLATLAQQWQLRLLPGHPVVPHPLVTLRPRYGMPMTLVAHEAASKRVGDVCHPGT